jgi:hypothetical protein
VSELPSDSLNLIVAKPQEKGNAVIVPTAQGTYAQMD